jgi:L-alanine-DL-glutamate epimerase-like enolase superfamily enzyme
MPGLRIVGVKVHVLKPQEFTGEATRINVPSALIRIITDEGVEGVTMLEEAVYAEELVEKFKTIKSWLRGVEEFTPLIGVDPFDRERIEKSLWHQYFFQRSAPTVLCALDECLWDIAGKALKMPIYKLIGAYREKIPAFASTQSYGSVEDYVKVAEECVEDGFKAIKIHPPRYWRRDIEVCRAVREAVGDDITLMLDPFHAYTREEALRVGREIERLGFYWYEDPIPTTDIEGLASLCRALDIQVLTGENIHDLYGYAELVLRGAADGFRCVDVNVGGITGMLKVAHLAEVFGMSCELHSWGHPWQQAAHLHVMLAVRNCSFFEMPYPMGIFDQGTRDTIRIDGDGYVHAPRKPGLGLDVDWSEIEEKTIKVISWPD